MTTTSTDLISLIDRFRNNPTAIQRVILQKLSEMTDGEVTVVDATNPFVFLLEASCCNAAAGMMQSESLTRKQYGSVAQTQEDLYLHMSDKDYLGRFAEPSRTHITILLGYDEIFRKAVVVPNTGGIKKLIVPRHTEITVADMKFTMQYPIEIKIMLHGGLAINYDVDFPSPLYELESNTVDWKISNILGQNYLMIRIPMHQFGIKSVEAQLNSITGFTRSYDFEDQFYYCRAYMRASKSDEWQEIRTTHTDQVYDKDTPTVVLKVVGTKLGVHIPQIYFNEKTIKDSLRLDIYSTKGPLELQLSNYAPASFSARWIDRDGQDGGKYSAPLNSYSALGIIGLEPVTGGRNELSFETLRDRVINRKLSSSTIPITPGQIQTRLEDMGYDRVVNLDNITDRQYLATRLLPVPTSGLTLSPMGMAINLFKAKLSDLAGIPTISDNGMRVTIKPDTLYRNVDGIVSIVPHAEVLDILNATTTTREEAAEIINSNNFLYSPFHYVLDVNDSEFHARPYRLNSPSVVSKFFREENEAAAIEVSTKSFVVAPNPTGAGYVLVIELQTGPTLRALDNDQIVVQLSYTPPDSNIRQFFQGQLISAIDVETNKPVDDRYIYRFDLDTEYDVDKNHQLIFEPMGSTANLTTMFDLVYSVRNVSMPNAAMTDIDLYVDPSPFAPEDLIVGVSHEQITIKFGEYLEHLWARCRSVVGEEEYARYSANVPATYPTDIYLVDELTGNIIIGYNTLTEEITTTKLHSAGDVILNEDGQTAFDAWLVSNPGQPQAVWWATLSPTQQTNYSTFAHLAGEVILDGLGQPTVIGGARGMVRHVDMFFLDGKYYFATDEATVEYRDDCIETLMTWITDDMESISSGLINRTELFFYPKSSVGKLVVMVGAEEKATIDAEQAFSVVYYLTNDAYQNLDLRKSLEKSTGQTLVQALSQKTISSSDIVAKVKAIVGNDVISFEVRGLAGDAYSTISMLDNSMRPSLAKRVVALSNKTLAVQDAVSIEFKRYKG